MFRTLIVALSFVFLVSGCGSNFTAEEKRQMKVLHDLGCHPECIPAGVSTIYSIEPMGNGYAIIAEPDPTAGIHESYAYWSNEGKIFAVNEAAKKCSPGLPSAPDGITFEAVKKCIQEARPK